MKEEITTMVPQGFNFVPDYYVMDRDCYWRNRRPVEPEYWPCFKRLQENSRTLVLFLDKPMAFSIDLIQRAFNPVHHMITNAVIRDSIFQFHCFIKNLDVIGDDWLKVGWMENSQSFILYLPTHKFNDK